MKLTVFEKYEISFFPTTSRSAAPMCPKRANQLPPCHLISSSPGTRRLGQPDGLIHTGNKPGVQPFRLPLSQIIGSIDPWVTHIPPNTLLTREGVDLKTSRMVVFPIALGRKSPYRVTLLFHKYMPQPIHQILLKIHCCPRPARPCLPLKPHPVRMCHLLSSAYCAYIIGITKPKK